jgi:hypothetical protein
MYGSGLSCADNRVVKRKILNNVSVVFFMIVKPLTPKGELS